MAQRVEQQPPKDEEDEIRAQVARYPRLSNAQEQRLLATQGAERDAANRTLIEHNLHLVVEAAQARKRGGVSFGDLLQAGTGGLISAVAHYKRGDGSFDGRLLHAIDVSMEDRVSQ